MNNPIKTVCVFCGSRMGNREDIHRATADLGRMLARKNRTIVYGGGHVGLMGILADAALSEDGRVIGVIPESLQQRELGHAGLTELHIVESMHHRKAMMAEMSDASIALPGGLGTYEEIMEAATWSLLGIQDKPLGFLNVGGFYDSMIAQLDAAAEAEFLLPDEKAIVLVDSEAEGLLKQLENFKRAGQPKWMTLNET